LAGIWYHSRKIRFTMGALIKIMAGVSRHCFLFFQLYFNPGTCKYFGEVMALAFLKRVVDGFSMS
jgi:hypothetical protein